MDKNQTLSFVGPVIDSSVIPTLCEYITIPNLSPSFDSAKTSDKECEKVISLFVNWVNQQNVQGLQMSVRRLEKGTPLIYIDIAASAGNCDSGAILMYGHMDKQPPFEGWEPDLGPYKPVIKNGRLYGRGGADDGYAIFSSICAIKAVQLQNQPHSRCVILIEASEESGSPDLMTHVSALISENLVSDITLVICLDSGSGDYKRLWLTTSLRGILVANVKITTLREGVHSGNAGGIASDSFRVLRHLLDSIENSTTAQVISDFQVEIPAGRQQEIKQLCDILGNEVWDTLPLVNNVPLRSDKNLPELVMNNTWRASLTVTGQDGLPPCATGGNVLRPSTTLKLSLRLPPTYDHSLALTKLQAKLQSACPPDATLEITQGHAARGYDAPVTAAWLASCLSEVSRSFYGFDYASMGCGGTIPFMGMLGSMFPAAQFVITGLLGPESNAHGPNEFLEIDFCKKLTCCIAHIVAEHRKVGKLARS